MIQSPRTSFSLIWLVFPLMAGWGLFLPPNSLGDEPPIRPRTVPWNGYHNPEQFVHQSECGCASCQPTRLQSLDLQAWAGQPYADKRLGCDGRCGSADSCQCDTECQKLERLFVFGQASIHWPRPFSAFWDERFPGQCCDQIDHFSGMASRKSCGHFFDRLDRFADIKLVSDVRRDNGYSGIECDPYGKLGASHYKFESVSTGPSPSPALSPSEAPEEMAPGLLTRTTAIHIGQVANNDRTQPRPKSRQVSHFGNIETQTTPNQTWTTSTPGTFQRTSTAPNLTRPTNQPLGIKQSARVSPQNHQLRQPSRDHFSSPSLLSFPDNR